MNTKIIEVAGYGQIEVLDIEKIFNSGECFDLVKKTSHLMPAKYVCDVYNKEGRKHRTCFYVAVKPAYKGLTLEVCKSLPYSDTVNVVGYDVQGVTTRRATH
jgi:hypothetical protein